MPGANSSTRLQHNRCSTGPQHGGGKNGGTERFARKEPMERQTGIWPGPEAHETPDWWPYSAEFPHWRVWRGISGLMYARRTGSHPTALVSGEDAVDLRDQIKRADVTG
jgi:hypothetical protein